MCNARKLTRHHFSGFKSLTLSNFIASTKSVDYHSFGSFHFLVTRGEKKKREIDPVGKTWKHFQLSLPCLSTANIVVSVSIIQLGVCARREKNGKKVVLFVEFWQIIAEERQTRWWEIADVSFQFVGGCYLLRRDFSKERESQNLKKLFSFSHPRHNVYPNSKIVTLEKKLYKINIWFVNSWIRQIK